MYIANPVYDNAFKYLMEDLNIAKGIIGRIIKQEILEIDFKPKEYTTPITSKFGISFLRMDFHAVILTQEGEKKKVLIELQKSKQSMDLFRFRRYLAEQYGRVDFVKTEKDKDGKPVEKPEFYPIITIYLLGYIEDARLPKVVKIGKQYYDELKEEVINGAESDFLEKLTHVSYMIQLANFEESLEKPLSRILSIFNQLESHTRIVEYPDEQPREIELDALVQQVLRRLSRAIQEEEVRKQLEYEEQFENWVANIFNELEENKRTLEEKDRTLAEKDRIINELQQKLVTSR